MGSNLSSLNCSGKSNDVRKKPKKKKKKLSDDVISHQDTIDGLHTKAGKILPRVSQNDKDLVEEQIRSAERRRGELQTRVDKARKQHDVVAGSLEDIKVEVDKYLAWLNDQERQMSEDVALGYNVKSAETRLKEQTAICRELQSKQATIEVVNSKVDDLIKDLPRSEREVVEQWVTEVSDQHHKVYRLAADKQKLLTHSVEQREAFQDKLAKTYQWLQAKEREASKLHTIRLSSHDVEKQVEKCKALQNEVSSHAPQREEMSKRVKMLHVDCTPEEKAELDHKFSDLESRYEGLVSGLANQCGHLRDCVAARKVFEADIQKNDKWCKETELKCATELCLDCALEVLDEQYKQYKTLSTTAQMFGSLVNVITETGQSFIPHLYEEDKFKLDQQLKSSREKYDRVATLIQERLNALEDTVTTRCQVQENMTDARDWIDSIQEDLRNLSKSSGSSVEDGEQALQECETIAEKIANYQPTIAQLNQAVERLRNMGQNTDADEILRMTTQYEILQDQVTQQVKKCRQGLELRQQFMNQKGDVEKHLQECEDQINVVSAMGQTLPVRIEKLKEISMKLQEGEPKSILLSDKAQQLAIESAGNDARAVTDQVQNLKSKADSLKKTAERKIKQCEMIQKNREEFEASIDEAINWLEQKEDILAHCGPLQLDTSKIEPALHKHNTLAKEALEKLDLLREKAQLERAHYDKLEEPLPPSVAEKLEQIQNLEDSIRGAITKKEQYFLAAKSDRTQFENSMKQINDWLDGAEAMTDSGYDTVDFDTLMDSLSEHKDYFHEASMCQDEMEQVMELSERLLPTLDSNDTETLRQTLKNTNQRLNSVITDSNRKQQTMEQKAEEWKDYQDTVMTVEEQLQSMEEDWAQIDHSPVVNQSAIEKQLTDIKGFLEKIEEMRPVMADLNDKTHELEKVGSSNSRTMISKLSSDINDRWSELASSTENRQITLQDLGAQWQDFTTLAEGMDSILKEVGDSLPEMDVEKATTQQLASELRDTKELCRRIEVAEPKITAMKRSAQNLLRGLPTAEAKVHTQEKLMEVLEKLERIQDKAQEHQTSLEEEIEDRDIFNKEAGQTMSWLTETKSALMNLDPGREVSDVMEKIEKQKVLEQEVAIRMEQMKHMAQLQETKYASINKSVPQEMTIQMEDIQLLESEVAVAMKDKEDELQHIKVDRQEVTSALKEVQGWLSKAELRLQERIIEVPESQRRHQQLLSEFDEFKPVLDRLRLKGSDLIQHTPDSVEKQIVQKSLADTNRQWLALQAKSVERGRRLNEAEELTQSFRETADSISQWIKSTDWVLHAPADFTDFSTVKDQLKQHRRLAKEVDQQQGKLNHLNSLLKLMESTCDASQARDKLAKLNQQMFKIQSDVSEKLNMLEDTSEEIDNYEHELEDLRKWMDETRAHLTVKGATMNLKDQLAQQEKILEDIEGQKGKALLVLEKHAELRRSTGNLSKAPSDKITSEITDLQHLAREQCDKLREAVGQQEVYEADIQSLTAAINEAQDKLLSSPVQASDVDTLKKQIAEHNALAAQIKSYQAKVNEINEKSRDLTEKSARLGPTMSDKLADLGYYPSSLSSLRIPNKSDSERPDSGVFFSPRSISTTQTMHSDDSRQGSYKWKSSPNMSAGRSPNISPKRVSSQSTDTTHGIGSDEIFDQSKPSGDEHSRLSLSENAEGLSNMFQKPDESDVSESASIPSVRFTPKWRSRSPSPTALCDEPIIPKQRYTPPQMYSLTPKTQTRPLRNLPPTKPMLKPFDPLADVSASVPNLLAANILESPRERSASFDSKTRPTNIGQSLGPGDTRLAELNTSWNALQQQLGAKEQQLQLALQKQERYQQAIQDVTAKMERVHARLSRGLPSSHHDLDKQIKDYKETLQDIDSIKEDISRVRERGRQIVETSDPEGYKAMQATLTMLSDRVENLQAMADDKGKQLQNAIKDKERHDIARTAYKKHLNEIEEWLTEQKIRQATTPMSTDTVTALKQSLQENQMLQNELNNRLQMVSDLAVHCDNLCEYETPANAEKLRSHLMSLQTQLGNLKLAAIEKQAPLRAAIKESDKRQKEMDDYETNVKKLQKWVTDTKQMTMAPPSVESMIIPQDHGDLQQQLRSDLSDHRQLLRQLSSGIPRDSRSQVVPEIETIDEADLNQKWETLSREIAEKKQNLQDILYGRDVPDTGHSLRGWMPPGETSDQLRDVRQNLSELSELWQQLQGQCVDRQLRLDQALDFQQKYQDALQNISSWLDLAEQKLFSPDADKDSKQMVRENEALQREIKSLQGEIAAMGRSSQDLLAAASVESQDLIRQSLANLNERVQILEGQAQVQGDKLRKADQQWKQYKDEVRNLQNKLSEIRNAVLAPTTSTPLDQLISNMQKVEAQLKKCEGQLDEVKKKADEVSLLAPQMVTPAELQALHNQFADLKEKIVDRKADILQSVSVQDQYEKMLQDYTNFLETANDKLRNETLSVNNLDELKQQLAAHKDFFSDLEVHRAMLDNLAAQTNQSTRQKHISQHTRLNNQTYVVLDKASLHGQKLDRMIRQWTELADKHRQLKNFLDDIESQIPRPVSSNDSVPNIQDKLNVYRRLQRELNEERPILFQVVDKGKQLLLSVNCSGLESEVSDLADRYVGLNSGITQELKRTESLGEHLQSFESEAAVLMSWISTAKSKLSGIKHLSDRDQQSIGTIRNKVDKLLEFRKEIDNQSGLKTKIMKTGNQLAQNKTYNTTGIQERMAWIEKEWAALQQDIAKTEEHLHQAQMDVMPSRQALNELATWLDIMEIAVKDEKEKPIKNLADIEIMLKKLKDFKIELQSKQLTVDFVNQSAMQSPSPELELSAPVSSDQTEFAERLGHLNKRWQSLGQDVRQTLKNMEMLHSKWQEFERALGRVQEWFREQEEKVTRYHLIGHEVSVKQTLKDCKALQESLKSKEDEIDNVKKLGERLVDITYNSPNCQETIQASLDNLNDQWRNLSLKVQELQNVLDDFLGQWNSYHTELQNTNQILSEADYCLSRYTKVGADLTTLRMQVDKLKNLNEQVRRGQTGYDRFTTLGNQLMQVCELPVRQEIQKTLTDIQTRWRRMSADLSDRLTNFEDCLQQWQLYEDEHSRSKTWLDTKEKLGQELSVLKDDNNRREECLQKSKSLIRDLDNFQSQMSLLYQLSDNVTKNMDSSSIVTITSRQSALEQRVMALRQSLAKQVEALQGDLSQKQKFRDLFSAVAIFLDQADRILGEEEMNKSTDEQALRERYDELKSLMSEFNNKADQLDALNDLGYRMALNEQTAKDLRDLNHKWQNLYAESKERNKTLQGLLLVQQDFTEKCDTWMTFLAQTEHDLATEIAGNLSDLQKQMRQCEKFESEMYSKQQILHAIISDGQKMMKEGEVENKEEFQQKLHLLAEQWQSVMRRANQRKVIIDNSIKQWLTFNDQTEKLHDWLKEKEYSLAAFHVDSVPLQGIKNMLERGRNLQGEFKSQEDAFKSIHDQSKPLLQRGDQRAKDEVKARISMLQTQCQDIASRLEGQCVKLEGVLQQWQQCEEEIEDIHAWLKDTRKTLSADLPLSYDELQAELHKCKDIEAAFESSEDKRQALLEKEKKLGDIIQPEDLNVLHQRIRLLDKQWDELRNQASQRGHRIKDNMFRWSSFNERIRDLHEWMDKMEQKILSSKEYHIEDLLNKFEREYKEEMMVKEITKSEVMDQGRRLMKVSSEVRAEDISSKLQRTEDKWNHLKNTIKYRKRKLEETLLAVRQLDTSMANLRKWLANMEHDLCAPILYMEADVTEIRGKLQEQQELQKDIEHHSAGVGSVLNLCEVLLHDTDACPTEVEFNALQTAMKNLDRRWRNICQQSPERRLRIENTWDSWQRLGASSKDFSDWLNEVEAEVLESTTDQLNVSFSKEEVIHFEQLQKEIHEKLIDLEKINKQYRKLAREGRTDHAGSLKLTIQDCNDRWDKLQQQVSSIVSRLKYSATVKEDFAVTKDLLFKWLTEVDVQLTDIEHLSSMDIPTKMAELKKIKNEIDGKQKMMEHLDDTALRVIQKEDTHDAARTQRELEEFKNYSRQVLERVNKYNNKLQRIADAQVEDVGRLERLTNPLASQIELDMLERQLRSDPSDTALADWDLHDTEEYLDSSPPESPPEKRRASGQGILQSRSPGRQLTPTRSRTPPVKSRTSEDKSPSRISRTSLRSMSPARSTSPLRSGRRSLSPTRLSASLQTTKSPRMSRSPLRSKSPDITRDERWKKLKAELSSKSLDSKVETLLESMVDALEDAKQKLRLVETELRSHTPTGSGLERSSENYAKYLPECEKSVEKVRTLDRLIKAKTGQSNIVSIDREVKNVLHRWEVVQAQVVDKDFKLSQHRKDWSQFISDVDGMLDWLAQAESLQNRSKSLPGDITHLDAIIRHHRESDISPFTVQDFLMQLESRKTRVQSINLLSKDFIDLRTEDGRKLHDKLRNMNRRWDAICSRATDLQRELQEALMRCQEFHHTVHDLLLWLESIENKVQQCEPINLSSDESALWSKHRKLTDLKIDLESNRERVNSLKETADQLLINTDSMEMVNARDKMHIVANRQKALLRLCSSYLTSLEDRLHVQKRTTPSPISLDLSDASSPRSATRTPSPRYSPFRPRMRTRSPFAITRQLLFGRSDPMLDNSMDNSTEVHEPVAHRNYFLRSLRMALPVQLLFLLLIGVASLVPMCEDDYSCDLVNNFRRSVGPMLQYTDGPPPV